MPNGSMAPTIPTDISNDVVMRAWYQEMWATVRDLSNERISVKDFGAAGDGIQDDTTAFTVALLAANAQTKVLWIPKGHYKITSTLTIANPVTILGEGKSVSIIEPFLGADGGDVFLVTCSDVIMKDFGFDGEDAGTVTLTNNMYMIHVNPTSGFLERHAYEDLLFQNFDFKAGTKDVGSESGIRAAYCIKIEDTDIVLVEDCYAKDVSGGFLYTTGVNHIETTRNYLEDVMLHPICIHDTTNYFNISYNHFNPSDTEGVFLGGLIDVTSAAGAQCHHGNIDSNFVEGVYGTPGYAAYGAGIRVLSSTDITISNNNLVELTDGTLNSDSDFVDQYNIKIGTYGTSSADDNGPCKRINILHNHIGGSSDNTNYHWSGILVENDYQTDSNHQAEHIKIIGNQLHSDAAGISYLTRGITINGKSSGIRNVIIEDNNVVVASNYVSEPPTGRAAVSIISADLQGACSQIYIGGNRIEDLVNNGAIAGGALLCIGQYTSEVFNTKPNYLKGYSYGIVIETGAGPDLWYLDNNYYEAAGSNQVKFVFNVQPKSYHTNISGNTASRPTSANYLTNYMTYFDTTLGTPMWYNGSSWVNANGSTTSLVDNSGTPVDNQLAIFTDANTIEGSANLTYDGSVLTVNDPIIAQEYIDLQEIATPSNPGSTYGRLFARAADGFTVLTYIDSLGTMHELARDSVLVARNTSGGSISKGEFVYVTGTTGVYAEVAKAKADTLDTLPALGAVMATVANNGFCEIMLFGDLGGLNTSAFTAGDVLYLSDVTAGAAINTVPTLAGSATQRVGIVISSHITQGILQIQPDQINSNQLAADSGSNTRFTLGDTLSILGGEGIDTSLSGQTITVAGENASDSNKGIASFDVTDFTVTAGNVVLNTERVSDIVGAMTTGNTETNIVVSYQDSDNTIDFVVDDFPVSGLADGTAGNLITWSAAGAPTVVATGTATHVLTSNGAGAAPTFQAAASAGAPVDAQYVTLATNGTLTNERVLTAGTAISITDAGAGSTATLAVTTVPVANGGTGQTSYTDGQLLIGATSGNTLAKATLTAGSGIAITNGTSSITVRSNGWQLITATTASSSSSVDFTGLSSAYRVYKLMISSVVPATDGGTLILQVGTGAGPTYSATGTDYRWGILSGWTNDASVHWDRLDPDSAFNGILLAYQIDSSSNGNTEITIYDPSQAAAYHQFHANSVYNENSTGATRIYNALGTYKQTTAVTAVRIKFDTGNIASGYFRLYGLADA